MPYQQGYKLPGEKASKLGHLDVLKSPLVQQLVHSLSRSAHKAGKWDDWQPFPPLENP